MTGSDSAEIKQSEPSDLTCLLYVSTRTSECSEEEMEVILDRSRVRNSDLKITGLLVYCQEHFLQVLEGPKEAVEQTYERITQDTRHEKLKVMVKEPVGERFFSDWSMAYKRVFDSSTDEVAAVQKILTADENGTMGTVKNMFKIFREFLD